MGEGLGDSDTLFYLDTSIKRQIGRLYFKAQKKNENLFSVVGILLIFGRNFHEHCQIVYQFLNVNQIVFHKWSLMFRKHLISTTHEK